MTESVRRERLRLMATCCALLLTIASGAIAAQYEVASRIAEARTRFPFEFAIMLGDNLYGSENARAYEQKFAIPYKPLLDAGVKFYAALGNHDEPSQRFYEPLPREVPRSCAVATLATTRR